MLADLFTKAMHCDRLVATFETGNFDIRPTAESLMIKEKNRVARKNVKERRKLKSLTKIIDADLRSHQPP